MLREFAIKYAMLFIGTWYKWGGDDPSGFDCSGIVNEVLKSVGILKRHQEFSSGGLYELYKHNKVDEPIPGALVFYTNSQGHVIHVEMCIENGLTIGASGGGSKTLTIEDAIRQNAFVKIRPVNYNRPVKGFYDPFKEVL